MSDDIVTRLRKHHEWFGTGGQPTSVWEDAADEIELLRSLNSALAACLEGMKKEVERLQIVISNG